MKDTGRCAAVRRRSPLDPRIGLGIDPRLKHSPKRKNEKKLQMEFLLNFGLGDRI